MRIAGLLLLGIVASFFFAGCAEEPSDVFETENFVRIYDHNGFAESFYPVDMVQTPDDGFLLLAGRDRQVDSPERGIYLLKVSDDGGVEKDLLLEDTFIRPVPGMYDINGKYYFFCMNSFSEAVLVETDASLENISYFPTGLSYPAAVSYSAGDGFLLLSYDQVDKKTRFSKVTPGGAVTLTRNFRIADNDSMEDIILQHFLKTGRQYPFAVGKFPNGEYYFNGFFDYTFSFVVTRLREDNDVSLFIHGQHENGGLSAVAPLSGGQFATAYFNFGSNYFVPSVSLAANPGTINNLGGYNMRELVPDAVVDIQQITVKDQPLLMYSTDVKAKQIGLFFYDQASGELRGSRYLGFSNPYEFGKSIVTNDGGVAVCGTTQIAGRFPRICLFKISKNELEKSIN
jgi:hypothetical protein